MSIDSAVPALPTEKTINAKTSVLRLPRHAASLPHNNIGKPMPIKSMRATNPTSPLVGNKYLV